MSLETNFYKNNYTAYQIQDQLQKSTVSNCPPGGGGGGEGDGPFVDVLVRNRPLLRLGPRENRSEGLGKRVGHPHPLFLGDRPDA